MRTPWLSTTLSLVITIAAMVTMTSCKPHHYKTHMSGASGLQKSIDELEQQLREALEGDLTDEDSTDEDSTTPATTTDIYSTTTPASTMTTPSNSDIYNCDDNNPCTPENADEGLFYFAAANQTQFIQCSEWGQCYVMSCPPGLVWSQAELTCNWSSASNEEASNPFERLGGDLTDEDTTDDPDEDSPTPVTTTEIYTTTAPASTTTTPSNSDIYNCDDNNPCTPENADEGLFYFAAANQTQFIQCSEWGQCYVMSCPPGLVWSRAELTCDWSSASNEEARNSFERLEGDLADEDSTDEDSTTPATTTEIYSTTTPASTTTTPSNSDIYNCDDNNPCTPENADAGLFYFAAANQTQFIQCSEWGQCYVMSCSPGLVWSQADLTCEWS